MTIKRPRLARSSSSLPEDRNAAFESRLMERDSLTKSLKQSVMSDEDSGWPIGSFAVKEERQESSDDSGSPMGFRTAPSSPVAAVKESDDSRMGILTVSSPPVAADVKQRKGSDGGDLGGGGGAGVEAFYEKCAWCEKKIDHGDDVFMYSYLRAFCSADCRSEQIRMDAKMEIASQMKKETTPEPSSKNNAVRLFGVGIAERHSDPHSHVN